MSSEPYTFDDMRAALVRQRSKSSISRPSTVISDPELLNVVLNRLIALIDAMTPDERKLRNVLQLSTDRQQELARITGTSVREVQA